MGPARGKHSVTVHNPTRRRRLKIWRLSRRLQHWAQTKFVARFDLKAAWGFALDTCVATKQIFLSR
jgi:hypothetical protein